MRIVLGALPPGYGRLGPLAREAIDLLARLEGLFVDPVYTAKALAVLIALVRAGTIAQGSRALFIHTGGLPALFAYEPDMRIRNEPVGYSASDRIFDR